MTDAAYSVIDRGLNDAGRGLNLVVIDSKTHEVVRVERFDTYHEGVKALFISFSELQFLI